jgi:hypothetical protein
MRMEGSWWKVTNRGVVAGIGSPLNSRSEAWCPTPDIISLDG